MWETSQVAGTEKQHQNLPYFDQLDTVWLKSWWAWGSQWISTDSFCLYQSSLITLSWHTTLLFVCYNQSIADDTSSTSTWNLTTGGNFFLVSNSEQTAAMIVVVKMPHIYSSYKLLQCFSPSGASTREHLSAQEIMQLRTIIFYSLAE